MVVFHVFLNCANSTKSRNASHLELEAGFMGRAKFINIFKTAWNSENVTLLKSIILLLSALIKVFMFHGKVFESSTENAFLSK